MSAIISNDFQFKYESFLENNNAVYKKSDFCDEKKPESQKELNDMVRKILIRELAKKGVPALERRLKMHVENPLKKDYVMNLKEALSILGPKK